MGNHGNHDQDSRPWELNPGLPNCETGVLPLHHTGSVYGVCLRPYKIAIIEGKNKYVVLVSHFYFQQQFGRVNENEV